MLLSLVITSLLLSFSVPVASAEIKSFESLSVGQGLPHDRWDDFGGYPTETLPGNGSTHWIGYIPNADVSFAYDRTKRIVVYVGDGKTAQDWFRDAVAGSKLPTRQLGVGGRAPEPVQSDQQKEGSFQGSSPTCGPIIGKTKIDLRNVKIFCDNAVPEEGIVVGAYSMQSLLWVKVSYEAAKILQSESLVTEQLVKRWMATWKRVCESKVVTIYVEWKDVEIARGETTVFSGDKVTLRK